MAGVPPKRGEAYTLHFSVTSQADTNIFQAAPTIAAGDFQVSVDGGATFNNPGTLPSVCAGWNKLIQAPLTIAEMTPTVDDQIIFRGSDAAGAEWQDILIVLTVATSDMDDVSTLTAANIWDRLTAALTTAGSIGKLLVDYINVAVSTRTTLGAGATRRPYTLTSSTTGLPVADADVWVTTDSSGSNVVASGKTNSSGVVVFWLDAGTYYIWRQKDGMNFSNPDTEVLT